MNKQQLQLAFRGALLTVGIVAARICVAMGRLIYAWYTGMDITNGAPLPTWQEEIFGDGFFYVGLAALIVCILTRIRLKKA
jgi:hypothetical protein